MKPETSNGYWRNRAACQGADTELFFPIDETSPLGIDQIERAKEFCVSCIVKVNCLEYAVETRQDDGIWGGVTADERKLTRRRRYYKKRNL